MGRYHPVKGGGVVALQKGDNMLTDAFAICHHCLGRPDILESGIRRPHVVRAHTAVLVAEPGQLGKRQHVHHEIPQCPPLTPGQVLLQLLIGELLDGAPGCTQHHIVLRRQPAGFARQIDLDLQA